MFFKKKTLGDERYCNLEKKYKKRKITKDEYIDLIYEELCIEAYNFFYNTIEMKNAFQSYLKCKKELESGTSCAGDMLQQIIDMDNQGFPLRVEARNILLLNSAVRLDRLYSLLDESGIDKCGMERNNYIAEKIYEKRDCEHVLDSPDLYNNIYSEVIPVELKKRGFRDTSTLAYVMMAESVRAEIIDEKPNTAKNENGFFPALEDDLIELMKQGVDKMPRSDKTVTFTFPRRSSGQSAD